MKEKFTQGDWSASGEFVIEVRSGFTTIINWTGFDDAGVSKEESRANANLIAAAPDMYRIMDKLSSCGEWFETAIMLTTNDGEVIHKEILSILARARGEDA